VVFLLSAVIVIGLSQAQKPEKPMPPEVTLELTLAQPMVERLPGLVLQFAGDSAPPSLQDWLIAMDSAISQPSIKGVYIRAVGGKVTLAQADELRDAIQRVQKAGKSVTFFADTFGEMDNGTGLYFLAAAADKVVLQPGGFVGINGIAVEQPFARGLLDKIGLLPEFEKRRAYKSAMDNMTERAITPENRAMLERLLGGLSGHVFDGIASSRKLPMADLLAMRDRAPLPAADAAKLLDGVQYEDSLTFAAPVVKWHEWAAQQPAAEGKKQMPRIALLEATGAIMRGHSGGGGPIGDQFIGAEDFRQTLRELAEDKEVQAVIIRMNSPGGSAIASETMHHAITQLRASGKPVIVSITDMAASGGYYAAVAANRILAQPSSLTGSIGVIVGKVSTAGLSEKLDVHWDEMALGKSAALFANGRGFSPEERATIAAAADSVYDTFKSRVATARKLSPEAVEALAQGQVWTGAEAKEKGLVDELGGLMAAIKAAKAELKLDPTARVWIVPYPDEDNPMLMLQMLLSRFGVMEPLRVLQEGYGTILRMTAPQLLDSPLLRVTY
jgi:protease-4